LMMKSVGQLCHCYFLWWKVWHFLSSQLSQGYDWHPFCHFAFQIVLLWRFLCNTMIAMGTHGLMLMLCFWKSRACNGSALSTRSSYPRHACILAQFSNGGWAFPSFLCGVMLFRTSHYMLLSTGL
jgi:hypothetical protein